MTVLTPAGFPACAHTEVESLCRSTSDAGLKNPMSLQQYSGELPQPLQQVQKGAASAGTACAYTEPPFQALAQL